MKIDHVIVVELLTDQCQLLREEPGVENAARLLGMLDIARLMPLCLDSYESIRQFALTVCRENQQKGESFSCQN